MSGMVPAGSVLFFAAMLFIATAVFYAVILSCKFYDFFEFALFYNLQFFIMSAILSSSYYLFLKKIYKAFASSCLPVNTSVFYAIKYVFVQKHFLCFTIALAAVLAAPAYADVSGWSYRSVEGVKIICAFMLVGLCVFYQTSDLGLLVFVAGTDIIRFSVNVSLYIIFSNFYFLFWLSCELFLYYDVSKPLLWRLCWLVLEKAVFFSIFKKRAGGIKAKP